MDSAPQGKWKCDECSATFTRLDHMKRHSLTHTDQRCVCRFCGVLFSRGDALRRHWKSCKSRLINGQDIPKTQRGGKHKRACDSCADIKKACSGTTPCSECSQRGRLCTYNRLTEESGNADLNISNLGNTMRIDQEMDVDADEGKGLNLDFDRQPTYIDPTIRTENEPSISQTQDMNAVASQGSWNIGLSTLYPAVIRPSIEQLREDRDVESKWDLGPSSFYPPMSTWPRRN